MGVAPPPRKLGPLAWDLERIRKARDEQLRGRFELPVRLAEAFRTDDALFVAYTARCATQGALKLCWRSDGTLEGVAAAVRAEEYIRAPQHVRQSLLGTMANHGIAIGYVTQTPEPDGSAIRYSLTEWPLEHVYYEQSTSRILTKVFDGMPIEITHGDGRWVIFRKFGVLPWTQDAAVLPGALLWPAHAGAISDWAGASFSHGQPKLVGELPESVKLQQDGQPTPEAQAFVDMLGQLMAGEIAAGIRPAGAKTDVLINESTAWQVFEQLGTSRERAAARIYLGTDAILGATGGAPGVDIGQLFNVASTRIQGDLEALERGLLEGMILPWCVAHGVDAELLRWEYEVPDTDADRRSEQEAAAIKRLADSLKAMRDSQLEVTQDTINALAKTLQVATPAVLSAQETRAVPLPLAPTDIARVVKVREARASNSLPPLGDERDDMTIGELDAATKAAAAPPAPAGPAPAPEPTEGA